MSANRLIHSTSPYLLQHAHNPVDWHPWGEDAFEKASAEDKPVFLSLGYAACHWCHVMERESFENPALAEVLNRHFVCIKVDREERPDLDETYMLATQLMTGRGGWPNSVWLLPDRRPWYAGTYFPPEDQFGRIGFRSLLLKLADLWTNHRDQVNDQATVLTGAIQKQASDDTGPEAARDLIWLVGHALARLQDQFDNRHGGLGHAPKFPPHSALALLLDLQANETDTTLGIITHVTLEAMQRGGIHDHVGGGFHRYATDAEWLVPHFEKMLYDNAQLALVYTRAWSQTREGSYRATAEDTLDWVLREMTDAQGGFHSSLDADSEGEEGRFYVWSHREILEALGPDRGPIFCAHYHIRPEGNFSEEASGTPTGLNIPHLTEALPEALREGLTRDRLRLRQRRDQRVGPGRDDKVIASWNGLMISALAGAGRPFQRPEYTAAAARAVDFILHHMWSDQTLARAWRQGACSGPGFLEDYAAVALALLDVLENEDRASWRTAVRELLTQMLIRFRDPVTQALASSGAEHGVALARLHDVYDQAMPSATSLAIAALHRGSIALNEPAWLDDARAAAAAALPRTARMPSGCCGLLQAARSLPGTLPPPPPTGPACEGDDCALPL